jgi:hypothetical protein
MFMTRLAVPIFIALHVGRRARQIERRLQFEEID